MEQQRLFQEIPDEPPECDCPVVLKIINDFDPFNPRKEFDNLGKMVCWHRRYNLGDKKTEYFEDDPEAFQEHMKAHPNDYFILPLYLYDHSGITMSTGSFSCPWDSGQVGYIYVSKEAIRKEWGVKRISPKLKKLILDNLRSEVNTYDQYITGDVWGFELVREHTEECEIAPGEEEDLDSCWGFYGSDPKENGMWEYIPEKYRNAEVRHVS